MKRHKTEGKRIEFYLASIVLSSVILTVLGIWIWYTQIQFLKSEVRNIRGLISGLSISDPDRPIKDVQQILSSSFPEGQPKTALLEKGGIFAFVFVAIALLTILILGASLSSRHIEKQLEFVHLKNEFISGISHALKTPLASIRLLMERLTHLKPEETDKQREYQSHILKHNYYLTHLVNNFLNFTRVEEGGQKYKFEKVNFLQLIKEAVGVYPVKLLKPNVGVALSLPESLPEFFIDKEAIASAFINLLDNAVKFSPDNGQIKVALSSEDNEVKIMVSDEGPGIEDSEKERIFERFYYKGKGTGLGLTLANHIVKDHGGRLEFESQVGKGATFKMVLPIKLTL